MGSPYNFLLPVETLTAGDIRLEPFESEKHAAAYWEGTGPTTELYTYMRMGPFTSKDHFIQEDVARMESSPTDQMYAIMTSRKPKNNSIDDDLPDGAYALAGITAYQDLNLTHLWVEVGHFVLLPAYQGTGLAPVVAELMVQHAFKDVSEGGWGLRRVLWMAHASNTSSIKLASRLNFQREGLLKWHMVYHDAAARGKVGNGRPLPKSSKPDDLGRDSVFFARCWDD